MKSSNEQAIAADPSISRLLTRYKGLAKDKDLAQESYFGGGVNGQHPKTAKHFVSHADEKEGTSRNKQRAQQETDAQATDVESEFEHQVTPVEAILAKNILPVRLNHEVIRTEVGSSSGPRDYFSNQSKLEKQAVICQSQVMKTK